MLTPASLTIRLHPDDDVVIARAQLVGGTHAARREASPSPASSRPATRSPRARIRAGEPVRRYNQIIGFASARHRARRARPPQQPRDGRVRPRLRVRRRREADAVRRRRRRRSWASSRAGRPGRDAQLHRHPVHRELLGHRRARHRRPLHARARCAAFPNVDGVVALTHGTGCGMDTHGEGMQLLRRTLGGYARHAELRRRAGGRPGLRGQPDQRAARRARTCTEGPLLRTFSIQDTGGTAKTDRARHRAGRARCCRTPTPSRAQPVPASHLIVGLQCGGSDGYSGITANPALGAAVDLLVRHGGTAILSETPEIYGAEHLLTRRAVSREVGEKLVARINWWEDYTAREQRRDEQQPVARQQGGRADDDPREVAGRRRQGRHHQPGRRLRVRRAGDRARASSTWTRPATTRCRRPGQVAGGANMIVLHHRPRLGLRLRAVAVAQAGDQHARCGCGRRRTSTSTAARSSTATRRSTSIGERIFRLMLETASGTKTQERAARLRPERVRALAAGRGDVRPPIPPPPHADGRANRSQPHSPTSHDP